MTAPENVPDGWGAHWGTCHACRLRYHLSEGGCDCLSDKPVKEFRAQLGGRTRRTSRKVRPCNWCAHDINVGEKYEHFFWKIDEGSAAEREHGTLNLHNHCAAEAERVCI